jgi:heat shock factor-binding protein 1
MSDKSDSSNAFNENSQVDTAAVVQQMLSQMQNRFQEMSSAIISRIDEMGSRIDELEKSITELSASANREIEEMKQTSEK